MAADAEPVNAAREPNPYQIGTLTYTRMGLVSLFFWLLWGDFCFTLMEQLVPQLVPLMLRDSGASNTTIGVLVGTVPAILNAVAVPIISVKSDRHRGRRGRRLPYLLLGTPFVALFLVLTGYAPGIAAWLRTILPHAGPLARLPGAWVSVGVIGVAITGFQFFNMFISSVYYYLFADTVPAAVLGRFMSFFRLAAGGAYWVWNQFVFANAQGHMPLIFSVLSAIYLVSFLLMCWRVKEGAYPPPAPAPVTGRRVMGPVSAYFTECFSSPYYVLFFLAMMFYNLAACSSTFRIFVYRDTLHLTLKQIGSVYADVGVVGMVCVLPLGWLMDRIHPVRAVLIGLGGIVVGTIALFFFVHDQASMLWLLLATGIPDGLCGVALLPMQIALLPKSRFGQFSSALGLLSAGGRIVGNVLAGEFMDWVKDYRYAFLWYAAFMSLTFLCLLFVYFLWRRQGGPEVPGTPAGECAGTVEGALL